MFRLIFVFMLITVLMLSVSIYSQSRVKRFEIIPRDTPANELQVSHEDCAVIVVHSNIPGLYFESNMNQIKTQEHSPRESKYRIYMYPVKQIVKVKATGFVEASLPIFSNPQRRQTYTFEINEAIQAGGKGNYTLTSDPPGASILIDGLPDMKLLTPYTFEGYTATSYNVTLKRDGYEDFKHTMLIEADRNKQYSAKLIVNYGELVVSTNPLDCDLYINNKFIAKTPISFVGSRSGLTPGRYNITLKKDRYKQYDSSIVVEAGKRNNQDISLEPLFVNVSITSDPEGSLVYLNETMLGKTPLRRTGPDQGMNPGVAAIRLVPERDFYKLINANAVFELSQDFSQHYVHEDLRRYLKLSVSDKPYLAYVDDQLYEVNSDDEIVLTKESFTLKVIYNGARKESYLPFEESLFLLSGEKKDLQVAFTIVNPEVTFESNVGLISFELWTDDNRLLGTFNTNKSHKLFPGLYTIKVNMIGYQLYERTLEISDRPIQKHQIDLLVTDDNNQQIPVYYDQQALHNLVPLESESGAGYSVHTREIPKQTATKVTESLWSDIELRRFISNRSAYLTRDPMVTVRGGVFSNGVSNVTISSFMMGRYEVSKFDFDRVMGLKSHNQDQNSLMPAANVSWYDAIEYCNKKSIQEGLIPCYSYNKKGTDPDLWPKNWKNKDTSSRSIHCNWDANGYRLPTEMEWMFAALGGAQSRSFTYSGDNALNNVGWYKENSMSSVQEIGAKAPNELEIFDLSGNLWEWCWDIYGSYQPSNEINPKGPARGSNRVIRGGSWYDFDYYCSTRFRSSAPPSIQHDGFGFRIVRKAN